MYLEDAMRVLALLAVAGLIAGTLAVQAQDAPSEMPIPRIETGMHVAPVIASAWTGTAN
jgi:hypothetical protein